MRSDFSLNTITIIILYVSEETKQNKKKWKGQIESTVCCYKKNLNATRPSEHPPVRRENVKMLTNRCGIMGCKYTKKKLFMAFKRVPR